MKKLLVCVLALSALFAFAACKDGKCDDCGTDQNVEYCDGSDEYMGLEGEYCPECATKALLGDLADLM